MFDYPDNDNQKGGNGESSTDREIGIFAGVLIGGIALLIALGLFLPALIVSFLMCHNLGIMNLKMSSQTKSKHALWHTY
ncbi:hypothetical protein Q7Q91_16390 [Lactiplantibacillus pentosus]|uniref:hypothetical protein n=1 Tax=Lactiplantibacillus pentosus TaxID=1589 RepID=UPI0026FCD045|nr:hypothetical protein [Lactiplantibacillus pentosus]MDO7806564.1 hypothetical protein [Lactiplantibacillus pentosus]